MVRNLLLLKLFLLITLNGLFAQPPVPKDVKNLYRQLRTSKTDTGRVNLLINISRYYNANSAQQKVLIDSAIVAAKRVNALSAKLSYSKGLGLSYQVWGQALCLKKDFKGSEELLRKAIAVFLANNLNREAAECYLNLQENYAYGGGKDYNIMADYYEKAHMLFRKAHAFDRDGATLEHLGDFYYLVEKYDRGISSLKLALVSYRLCGKRKTQAVYDLLGINYLKIERYKDALKNALIAVKTAEAVHDTSMLLCTIYNRTGMIYLETSHFDQANFYFKKSIAVAQKYKDPSAIFLVANLANNLIHQQKPVDAITSLNENERHFPDIDQRYRIYYNALYLQANVALKNYQEAKKYAQRLLKAYAEGENDPVLVVTMLGPPIEYFIAARNYQEAAKLMPAFKNAVNASGKIKFTVKLHFFKYKIDSAQHNYVSALNNYQKYAALQDSISEATKNKQVQQLQVQFETEQKENAITSLKHEGVLQREKITRANNTRNLTIAASVMLLVVAGVSLNSYRTKQRGNKALNVLLKEKDKLLIDKEWLLKEIHHRVKNNLQIVMGLLQRQSAYINNEEALAAIQNSENRMHSIALIHQKLYQSENLDLINMPEYIDEMLSYLKHSCDLDNRILFQKHTDDILLDVAQAVPLGLILNEAVTNAIKYAYEPTQTGTIYVTLVRNGDSFNQLTIADDGGGLPAGFAIDKVESLGINLMRGLSKQLGGTFDIYGDEGCTINVVFKTEVFSREISKNE